MAEIEIISTFISTVGFPIVAFYLMYDLHNKGLAKLTEAIQELKVAIAAKV